MYPLSWGACLASVRYVTSNDCIVAPYIPGSSGISATPQQYDDSSHTGAPPHCCVPTRLPATPPERRPPVAKRPRWSNTHYDRPITEATAVCPPTAMLSRLEALVRHHPNPQDRAPARTRASVGVPPPRPRSLQPPPVIAPPICICMIRRKMSMR
jgi:hypothetical protein